MGGGQQAHHQHMHCLLSMCLTLNFVSHEERPTQPVLTGVVSLMFVHTCSGSQTVVRVCCLQYKLHYQTLKQQHCKWLHSIDNRNTWLKRMVEGSTAWAHTCTQNRKKSEGNLAQLIFKMNTYMLLHGPDHLDLAYEIQILWDYSYFAIGLLWL